ncbi:hypothetical protein CHU98_g11673, partial [Xylaria longipes]
PAKKASAKKSSRSKGPHESTISLEQVKQEHDRFASEWKSSPAYAQVQEILSGHTASNRVTKAICFGLGSFDPPDGHYARKRQSHTQLAAFLAIVEHLQSKANNRIRCIFQEPIFTTVDKAFITNLGHEVVESPVGFQLVDSETLTFGIHLYKDVCSKIVATCFPAIYIGTSYEFWNDLLECYRIENMGRMEELEQTSVRVKFPDNKSETVFEPTRYATVSADYSRPNQSKR